MTISAALVLFAVIWFMTLFIALPIGMKSQRDAGEVVPGTPASAPSSIRLGRKALWVTVVTVILWVPTCAIIISGVVSVEMFDLIGGIEGSY